MADPPPFHTTLKRAIPRPLNPLYPTMQTTSRTNRMEVKRNALNFLPRYGSERVISSFMIILTLSAIYSIKGLSTRTYSHPIYCPIPHSISCKSDRDAIVCPAQKRASRRTHPILHLIPHPILCPIPCSPIAQAAFLLDEFAKGPSTLFFAAVFCVRFSVRETDRETDAKNASVDGP
jgi:hypothetical protein